MENFAVSLIYLKSGLFSNTEIWNYLFVCSASSEHEALGLAITHSEEKMKECNLIDFNLKSKIVKKIEIEETETST